MPQSNLCIRMDENLKKQFDHLCDELGLTMSTAINIFVKKFMEFLYKIERAWRILY